MARLADMFLRYRQNFLILIFFLCVPILVGFFLLSTDSEVVLEKGLSSLHSQLAEYQTIFAKVFSVSGQMDYKLSAKRLILQSDFSYRVYEPIVNISQIKNKSENKGVNLIEAASFSIGSNEAVFTDEYLTFSGAVKFKSLPDQYQKIEKTGMIPVVVRSDFLKYEMGNQYFVANGSVQYCRGVEEITANKVSGYIDQEDFVFVGGKIFYRRSSRCV